MARETSSKRTAKPSPSSPPKRNLVSYYLLAYNVLSALGWAYVLGLTLVHLTNLDGRQQPPQSASSQDNNAVPATLLSKVLSSLPSFLTNKSTSDNTKNLVKESLGFQDKLHPLLKPIYQRATTAFIRVGGPVTIVQSFAILEVAHVLLRLVKSALVTTAMQIASRIYLIWGILSLYPEVRSNPIFASMVFAWSTTEVIRYSFYALNLLGKEFAPLTYLRYTTFYILYPMGALSEAALIYATLPARDGTGPLFSWKQQDLFVIGRFLLVCVWVPGLVVMMMHMQAQRNKVLGRGRAHKLSKKSN